jgi:hypothetical protein
MTAKKTRPRPKAAIPKDPTRTGRPPLFPPENHSDFVALIEEYFDECDAEGRPYTVPGLSYHLGFCNRKALLKGGFGEPPFSDTIQKAKSRIERQRVESLVAGKGSTPGQIFDLKNNFSYADKIENVHSGPDGGPIEIKQSKFILVEPGDV